MSQQAATRLGPAAGIGIQPDHEALPAFNRRIVLTLLRRELQDSLRDWRIMVPVFLLTGIFPFLMNLTARLTFDFLSRYDAGLIAERMVPFGMLVVGFFPITFSLVISLETFVGEKERNSLEALFATPASDLELYLGKLLAALLLPLAAAYVGTAVYVLGIQRAALVSLPAELLLQILLLITLKGLVMVSGAVIVSSHTTSVRASNLLASFIIIPAALLVQVEALLMFWASYDALWAIAAGLVVVVVILIRAGMRTFNREEILSRELDVLNLRRIAQLWSRLWRAAPAEAQRAARTLDALSPLSARRLYRTDLPALLREARPALGAAGIVMAAGFVIGLWLTARYPLPPGLIDLSTAAETISREGLADRVPGWSVLPKFNAGAIFGHNARAVILALLASFFSFGALSLLLIGLPMTVVGFLAGQVSLAGQSGLLFLAAFILPHALLEIPATLIATAFSLRIGAMLISPPARFTAGEALLRGLADFTKVFLLLVLPLLAAAAVIEVYVTPAVIGLLY